MKKLSINDVSKMMASVVRAEDESSLDDVIRRLLDISESSEETTNLLFEESKKMDGYRIFLMNFIPFMLVSLAMLLISLVFGALGIFSLSFGFPYIAIDLAIFVFNIEALVLEIKKEVNDRKIKDSLHRDIIVGNIIIYAMYKKTILTPLHQVENKGGCNEGN